ncbi:ATP-dependent DNA helicase DinG [Bacillus shivajii]|uniref:ATP-dependent DNA helicase DinG n=1 Tax=Bacillus shivajii TaxID=1983719 RepID=UPI001CFB2A99|nr:ATP-dependent DNA helicase DinG [Bacillus shivajii]UCZ54810.1 ATP-dependent DNA helicase DinG [Bacillus shivajii]
MNRFLIIDVETTGVSFSKGDRIIQIAYVVVEGQQIIKRFSSYINPEKPIPRFIQSLTNIEAEHVDEAPLFEEVAPQLLNDLDGAYFVAHNVDFDLSFINDELVNAGYEPYRGLVIDTVELAKIAYPTSDGFKLSQLTANLNMDHNQPHRADSDAEATSQLFLKMIDKLSSLPLDTLKKLDRLQKFCKSDLQSLMHEWMNAASMKELEGYDYYRGFVLRKTAEEIKEEEAPQCSFETYYKETLLNEEKLKGVMTGYEQREGQLNMAQFIYDQFERNSFGLIEAGTGTGKTLAYLIPAAFYSKIHSKRIVISTHTVQLQEQMLKKDLHTLAKILPFAIKTGVLKGRSHYLCLQKFERLLEKDPFDSYDRTIAKAQILVWLTETKTGDVEELNLATSSFRFWKEIASDYTSCTTPKCPWFSRCFYQRAKQKAKESDLIITNHSLVLSDMKSDHQVIPSYNHIIIDEAHHFEETATEQFGEMLDYLSLTHIINDLGSENEGVLSYMKKETFYNEELHVSEVIETSKELKQEWNELFLLLRQYLNHSQIKRNERGRANTIINRSEKQWEHVLEAAKRCFMQLSEWTRIQAELQDRLSQMNNSEQRLAEMLQTIYDRSVQIMNGFNMLLLDDDDENFVYWLEADLKGPKQSVSIQKKPIHVAEKLADAFFAKKDSVIFTSATLSVKQSFQYFIQRLGLEDFPVETKLVQSPFDWGNQVKLCIPEDMPMINEAGESGYIEAAALNIYRISQLSEGKMLVLFTSYDMLKKCYEYLRELLTDDYMLIAQGVQTGSRSKLTKNFQQFDKAILLGTSSFWEGVDIPGNDLSVIVIVRLPFSPPDDPVFKAKSDALKEQKQSPFMKLALPQAVIRFKQGFGRLIRTSNDRGAVIVLDRRIVTARYGKSFIESLPQIPVLENSMDELEKDLENWL